MSRPSATVSLMPQASLLTVLKVAGATTIVVAGGSTSGSPGCLYWTRTGWPVSSASWAMSRNLAPSGVAMTAVSQPWSWAKQTKSASWAAGGPPQAMT